jgi:hypothetical protein
MHQTLFVVDALFQGNHGFRSTYTINVINFKDNVFGMCGIACPDLAENVEFSCGDVRNGHIGYLVQPFENEFGLMGLL